MGRVGDEEGAAPARDRPPVQVEEGQAGELHEAGGAEADAGQVLPQRPHAGLQGLAGAHEVQDVLHCAEEEHHP